MAQTRPYTELEKSVLADVRNIINDSQALNKAIAKSDVFKTNQIPALVSLYDSDHPQPYKRAVANFDYLAFMHSNEFNPAVHISFNLGRINGGLAEIFISRDSKGFPTSDSAEKLMAAGVDIQNTNDAAGIEKLRESIILYVACHEAIGRVAKDDQKTSTAHVRQFSDILVDYAPTLVKEIKNNLENINSPREHNKETESDSYTDSESSASVKEVTPDTLPIIMRERISALPGKKTVNKAVPPTQPQDEPQLSLAIRQEIVELIREQQKAMNARDIPVFGRMFQSDNTYKQSKIKALESVLQAPNLKEAVTAVKAALQDKNVTHGKDNKTTALLNKVMAEDLTYSKGFNR